MPAVVANAETRIVLDNISWETYERMLSEHVQSPSTRFTYDEGRLEIMVVSIGHERPNRNLATLVEVAAIECGKNVCAAGSTTFRREDLHKGFEPDTCFYFEHAARMNDRDEYDPAQDPPPGLAIEVEISRASLDRFPIFAAFGVPEVWRYVDGAVRMYELAGARYNEIERSRVLDALSAADVTRFLEAAPRMKRGEWVRSIREWVGSGQA